MRITRSPRTLAMVAHACLFVVLAGVVSASAQQSIVVTNATIIDGTGGPPISDGTIIITDGRIAAIGKRAAVQRPAGAREINAAGKFVIPGLMDANVHLVMNMSIEFHARDTRAATRT